MSDSQLPLFQRRALDTQLTQLNRASPQPWGVWSWLGPVVSLLALIAVLKVVAHEVHFHGTAIATANAVAGILGDGLLLAAVAVFGHNVAAAGGGWRRTFGVSAPTRVDLRLWLTGMAIVFGSRIVITAIANGFTHGKAGRDAVNIHLHGISHTGAALLLVATVVAAPVVEELMFRGLLLRVFMRRFEFWPAAILGSLIFALLHTYEVHTLAGAATLGANTLAFALTNCLLVRITARLTPGLLVHASLNLIAAAIAIHRGH